MNVLFLTNKFVTGGAERYILKKADYLRKLGHNACIVSAGGDYTPQLAQLGIPFVDIPGLERNLNLLEPWELLPILATLGKVVRQQQIDIIEIDAPAVLEIGISVAHGHGIPFLLNVFLETAFGKGHDSKLLEACARSGRLFFLSDCIKDLTALHTGASLDGAQILPIPVDPAELACREGETGLAEGLFIFLSIARMSRDKAYLGVLIDEYATFCKRSGASGTRLVIVGDGKDYPAYQRKVANLNQTLARTGNGILLTGSRSDIAAFYRRADVYIGMGTTVLEAAFYAKPVILSSLYPHYKGSIGYFGRVGYESVGEVVNSRRVFTPFSTLMAETYASAELRQQLAEEGRANIVANYQIDAVMTHWLTAYCRLIDNFQRDEATDDVTTFVYRRESQRIRLRKARNSLLKLDLKQILAENFAKRKG